MTPLFVPFVLILGKYRRLQVKDLLYIHAIKSLISNTYRIYQYLYQDFMGIIYICIKLIPQYLNALRIYMWVYPYNYF